MYFIFGNIAFIIPNVRTRNRDEIRFAHSDRISGRRMSVCANTTAIFLVSITKSRANLRFL